MSQLSRPHQVVGLRIRKLREDRGISQEQLAIKVGITTGYMGQLERAERALNLEKLFLIAKALKVDAAELLKGV